MSGNFIAIASIWTVLCVYLGYVIGSSLSFDMMWSARIREAANKVAAERPELLEAHRRHVEQEP